MEIALNEDIDATLELLAALITAQPQYIALGIQNPLADSLKQTAGFLRNRGAQIDAVVNGDFTTDQHAIQRFGNPLTLDLNGDGIETVPLNRPPPFCSTMTVMVCGLWAQAAIDPGLHWFGHE